MDQIEMNEEREIQNWSTLPEHSRVWIYASDRELTVDEEKQVQNALSDFISRWAAHGTPLRAEGKLIDRLFIVLVADEEQTKASGCSIDDSVHFIKSLGEELGVDFFNRMITHYLKDGKVHLVKLHEFWAMRKAGIVDAETIVFNNLITNLGQLKTMWKLPFRDSWHQEMWS
jgi:hypothetical protein